VTPLFAMSPTLEHPAGLVKVWFFDAATIFDQVLAPSLTDEGRIVSHHRGRGAASGSLHLERPEGDVRARLAVVQQSKADSENASPFVCIAAVTGVGLLRMLKMPIELVSDLAAQVAELLLEVQGPRTAVTE